MSSIIFFFALKGMFSSRGRRLLMADADGASKFADLAKLEKALDDLNGKKVSSVFQNCAKWTKALLGWSWNACRKPRGIVRGVPGRPGVYLWGFFPKSTIRNAHNSGCEVSQVRRICITKHFLMPNAVFCGLSCGIDTSLEYINIRPSSFTGVTPWINNVNDFCWRERGNKIKPEDLFIPV